VSDEAEPENAQTETQAPVDIAIAYQAALAARQETFLAHYPRKLKLVATVFLFFALAILFPHAKHQPVLHQAGETTADHAKPHEDDINLAAIPTSLDKAPSREHYRPKTEDELLAAAANDSNNAALPLAPDRSLVEEANDGPLPKIGANERRPWQVYAKPFDFRDPRPRIALVMGDLGLSRVVTDTVMHRLPSGITLAFDTEGTAIDEWLTRARQGGYETILSIPMEPFDYPRNDPGPHSLLTTLPNADNIERLHAALRLGSGYVGITTLTGSRFMTDSTKVEPLLDELRARGLLVFDAKVTTHSVLAPLATRMKVPLAVSSRVIDSDPTPQAIAAALAQLEQTARVDGVAIAVASPLPVTIDGIEAWAKHLGERGIALAPLSAVVR
jgi:polysaccharide deacetylase 2 family uncharacterized protein YibQ